MYIMQGRHRYNVWKVGLFRISAKQLLSSPGERRTIFLDSSSARPGVGLRARSREAVVWKECSRLTANACATCCRSVNWFLDLTHHRTLTSLHNVQIWKLLHGLYERVQEYMHGLFLCTCTCTCTWICRRKHFTLLWSIKIEMSVLKYYLSLHLWTLCT